MLWNIIEILIFIIQIIVFLKLIPSIIIKNNNIYGVWVVCPCAG